MAKAMKRLDGKVELTLETEREICAVYGAMGSVIGDPRSTLRGETDLVFNALVSHVPRSFNSIEMVRGTIHFEKDRKRPSVIDPKTRLPGIGERVKVFDEESGKAHYGSREIVAVDAEARAVRLKGDIGETAWFVSDGSAFRYGRMDMLVLVEPEAS